MGAAGKGKIGDATALDDLEHRGHVGSAEQPVDSEFHRHPGGLLAGFARRADDLQIGSRAARPDRIGQPMERFGVDADVLESDMTKTHPADLFEHLQAIDDCAVLARQHENEINHMNLPQNSGRHTSKRQSRLAWGAAV